jgi:hypothetical protein
MRGTRCLQCKEPFNPRRADALYCQQLCRQAAYHQREKVAKAASVEQRKVGALQVIDRLNTHQTISNMLHAQAKANRIDVSFMPVSSGVIAVEGRPGAFDAARAILASFPYIDQKAEVSKDQAQAILSSGMAAEAEAYAILSSEHPGKSFVAREAEAECREAVARGGNVYELRASPDYIARRNRAARFRNDGAKFLGLHGSRCRCGNHWDEGSDWVCCGDLIQTDDAPDAPPGFPNPRGSSYG